MPSWQLPGQQRKSPMLGWLLPSWLPCRSQRCFPLNWRWLWITRAQPGASMPGCFPWESSWTEQGWPSPPLNSYGSKNRIFPCENSLEIFSKYQTTLLVQGPLTCQTDVIAALGCCIQQGTKALALCTLVDASIQLPRPPSLFSEVLVGIKLLGGSVWHGTICR